MSDSECGDSPRKQLDCKLNRYPLVGLRQYQIQSNRKTYIDWLNNNITATPKGVAIYFIPIMLRGEEVRYAHLIPSL